CAKDWSRMTTVTIPLGYYYGLDSW
nr:immunoglobulin heavy chain junction region [Macaca mulatta]MOY21140.1 immunoglobulin heavy chain junction region [Macaca mulatta]MOY21355.1 immunoglobulin heavy chain junction region [Macaca mulatta]MOY21768.1 immunoglobulin heavy chain junction region [Macaca mulatta]MOY23264.1 immunoglobulin heavy chain junction region [Macaca mulatta]